MRKSLLLVALFGLVLASPCRGADDTRALLDRAVKAHGGREKLDKLLSLANQSKARGKLHLLGGIDISLETTYQKGKFKQVMQGKVAGTAFTQVTAFDGKAMRITINGKEIKLDDPKLVEEAREQVYADEVSNLTFLRKKGFELSPLGEMKIEGRPALGVRVSSKGHRDVNLWFDKDKALLVKIETRGIDFQSHQEATQEKILGDYKDRDGIPFPGKLTVKRDGKPLLTLEIEEVKQVEPLDDDFFAKP